MEKEEWIKVWFNCITISTGSLDLISGFHVIPTWLRSSLRYHGHILISNFQSSTVQSAEHDFFHCMNSTLQCIRRIWAPQEEDCEMEINMQEIDEKKPWDQHQRKGIKMYRVRRQVVMQPLLNEVLSHLMGGSLSLVRPLREFLNWSEGYQPLYLCTDQTFNAGYPWKEARQWARQFA